MLDPSFLGDVNVSILPRSDNTYDIGSSTLRWKDLWLGGHIYVGDFSVDQFIKITSASPDYHYIGNCFTNEFGIQPHTYFNIFLGHNYGGTWNDSGSVVFNINNLGNVAIGFRYASNFKLEVDGSVGPHSDNAYDLGSSSYQWRNLYLGNQLIIGGDVVLYRGSANLLVLEDQFRVLRGASTDYAITTMVSGDSDQRLRIRVDGVLEWGDGTNPPDVVLYREGADILQTDDVFKALRVYSNVGARPLAVLWEDGALVQRPVDADSTNTLVDSPYILQYAHYWDGTASVARAATILHRMLSTAPTSEIAFRIAGSDYVTIGDNGVYIKRQNGWEALRIDVGTVDSRIRKEKVAGAHNWFWLDAYADSGYYATIGFFRGTVDGTPRIAILKGNGTAGGGIWFYPRDGKIVIEEDTNLYRSAANVLKTDDNFDASALRIGGTEVITSGRVLQNIASVAQTLLPDANGTRDLGSWSQNWREGYFKNIILGYGGKTYHGLWTYGSIIAQFNSHIHGYGDALQFRPPNTAEYLSGGTWYSLSVPSSIFQGSKTGSFTIEYGWEQVRFTWTSFPYRFFEALYLYYTTRHHSMTVKVERSTDGSTWEEIFTTGTLTGWPNHGIHVHYWHNNGYPYLRITIIPSWNADYPDEDITIHNIRYFTSYPAYNARKLFEWDTDRNLTFYGSLKPTTDNAKDLGSSSYRWKDIYGVRASLLNDGTGPILKLTAPNATPWAIAFYRSDLDAYARVYQDASTSLRWQAHMKPHADNTYDLGTSSLRWRNGYFVNLYDIEHHTETLHTGDIVLRNGFTITELDEEGIAIKKGGEELLVIDGEGNIYLRGEIRNLREEEGEDEGEEIFYVV